MEEWRGELIRMPLEAFLISVLPLPEGQNFGGKWPFSA